MPTDLIKITRYILSRLHSNIDFNITEKKIKALTNSVSLLALCHASYVYSTIKIDNINIIDKYHLVSNGNTLLMVKDDKNRHFNINNSFWFWKWNAIEDYYSLNNDTNINIFYYGYRIPCLGIFPIIFNITNKNNNINNITNNYFRLFEANHWLVI